MGAVEVKRCCHVKSRDLEVNKLVIKKECREIYSTSPTFFRCAGHFVSDSNIDLDVDNGTDPTVQEKQTPEDSCLFIQLVSIV